MILGLKGGEAGSNRGESFLFLVVKIAKSLRFRKKVSDQGFDFLDFRWGWSKKNPCHQAGILSRFTW
ncbi:hypothetical protein AO498_13105 [Algoriphagus sanaruensis]|uniref:Uncharacterized protein n=1 Tax=Algoriphagus sanaruensis TaxID=1727163 RepID=A0A142EQH4_9BACT|nr:hypothetical protein AO498_13105 [Algoriphagus sanaruensis]